MAAGRPRDPDVDARILAATRALLVEGGLASLNLTEVARLAKLTGGRAKPSGAGGGDVAIAFFADARDAQRFDAHLQGAKFETLELTLGAEGPRAEESVRHMER